MRHIASALAALVLWSIAAVAAAQTNQLTPEQIAEGWINLFDGETLFGWHPTSDANWKVEDGAITVSEGEQGFLMTGVDFADYELHVEFKAPATTNSGLFLRTPLQPTDPAKDCYELNIAPADNPFPTGSFVGRIKQDVDRAVPAFDNAWHTFVVKFEGADVVASLDGSVLQSYDGQGPARGRIALQFREGPVAFRSIRVKPLGLNSIFNGKDLAGWDTRNVEASKFEAADGELRVTNGRGILETEASYGDFVMQLDAYVDGDNLNSGIFFRSIPREYAKGYESQIHNGTKNGDAAQPSDFGTGAIYRRTPARRVVSKDREWFTKTIIATGPHIAVWVNGTQVTDWTDERAPDPNPRAGLRLDPGTISVQGHDPTTNLRFRNLRIAELPQGSD